MAKGDVTLKFDANTAEFISKVLQARGALDGVATSMKNVEHSAGIGEKALDGIVESLGVVTTVAGAAAAGVELVMKSAEEYISRVEERAKAVKTQVETLASAMASAGQLGAFPAVNSAIQNMAGGKFSEAELSRAAGAVFSSQGFKASPQQITASLGAYAQAREGGMNEAAAIDVATQFARLAPSGNQDQALAAHVAGLSDEDMRVFNRAGGSKSALNLILAAHKTEEGGRTLAAIDAEAGLAGEDTRGMSTENRKKRRQLLAAMKAGGGDAFSTILANPSLLGDEKQIQAARNLARGATEIAQHPLPTLEDQARAVRSDPALALRQYQTETEAKMEQANEGPQAAAENMGLALRERVLAEEKKKGGLAMALPEWMRAGPAFIYTAAADIQNYANGHPDSRNGFQIGKDAAVGILSQIRDAVTRHNSTLTNDNEGQK